MIITIVVVIIKSLKSGDSMKTKESKYTQRNRKIAANRGDAWRKKLVAGKYESQNSPTIIKTARIGKAISQDAVAKELDISLASYGSIERGIRPIKKPLALFIANYFNLKLEKAFKEVNGKFVASKK